MSNPSLPSHLRRVSPAAMLAELGEFLGRSEPLRPASPLLRAALCEALREGTYPSPTLLLRTEACWASAQ